MFSISSVSLIKNLLILYCAKYHHISGWDKLCYIYVYWNDDYVSNINWRKSTFSLANKYVFNDTQLKIYQRRNSNTTLKIDFYRHAWMGNLITDESWLYLMHPKCGIDNIPRRAHTQYLVWLCTVKQIQTSADVKLSMEHSFMRVLYTPHSIV